MKRAILNLSIFLIISLVGQTQQLYIKPQLNFNFVSTKTIRKDNLPYAKIDNHHRKAFITPGLRVEYIKPNENGYFFNFTILPLGFATKYTDYAHIDPVYRQQATTNSYTAIYTTSASSDIWAFDIGFIKKLVKLNLSRRKQLNLKIGLGGTIASVRRYTLHPYFTSISTNSMGKQWENDIRDIPNVDLDKSKTEIMLPLKLNFNIKSKARNAELLNVEFSYWQGFSHWRKYNIIYRNLTDNVDYNNVVESNGTTWQIGVHIPIRIKLKK